MQHSNGDHWVDVITREILTVSVRSATQALRSGLPLASSSMRIAPASLVARNPPGPPLTHIAHARSAR
jgi:hypothetical protein